MKINAYLEWPGFLWRSGASRGAPRRVYDDVIFKKHMDFNNNIEI